MAKRRVDRSEYRFSVTVSTERREVLYCLRGLSMAAQITGNNKLPWSGQTDAVWKGQCGRVTFRFTLAKYREQFLHWAESLFPENSWLEVMQDDDNPPC